MTDTRISLFKGYADTRPVEMPLTAVMELVRSDKSVQQHTERYRYYRSQGMDKAADYEKANTPCFAVAVRFNDGKRQADICGWTAMALVDIDHIPAERMQEVITRVNAGFEPVRVGGKRGYRVVEPDWERVKAKKRIEGKKS